MPGVMPPGWLTGKLSYPCLIFFVRGDITRALNVPEPYRSHANITRHSSTTAEPQYRFVELICSTIVWASSTDTCLDLVLVPYVSYRIGTLAYLGSY